MTLKDYSETSINKYVYINLNLKNINLDITYYIDATKFCNIL